MPPADSTTLIVARFLKSNGYAESYQSFLKEAGLPHDAGVISKGDLTLETLLEEKRTFDLSIQFEKLGYDDVITGWRQPAPEEAHTIGNLPASSNLLNVTVERFGESQDVSSYLLASSADRRLHILNAPSCTLRASLAALQDSPILSCAVLRDRILLSTSMSGQLLASDLDGNILDKCKDHQKYVVKVAALHHASADLVATAGWDNKVLVYKPTTTRSAFSFGGPVATIALPTKPEAILFLRHPDNAEAIVVLTRADSNHLFFYTIEREPRLLGKQNLAPNSNAWVAFTPSALALCPTDPSLVAVGTSTVPHMKLLIVRLLIPPYDVSTPPAPPQVAIRRSLSDDTPVAETQASQARAALAVAEREGAAIQIHCTTMAPQTAYSTPAVAWRPDGSGVWVNGDDGAVRGIEASTGKVVSTLHGHEEGSKVRCLWAGMVDGNEEWLVTGAFDQRLIVWKVKER